MSHFAVLVLHNENQDIEKLLAPYDESLRVESYFEMTKEEALKNVKEEYVPYNDFLKEYTDEELIEWYVNEYNAYSLKEDGVYSSYNPNSKWDWYQIGGRFGGELELTDEGLQEAIKTLPYEIEDCEYEDFKFCDSAPVKCIKWVKDLNEEELHQYHRWWAINVEGEEPKDGESKDEYFYYKPSYFKERYANADIYTLVQILPCYHAVITSDGIWHEESEMGWFGCTNGEPAKELLWDLNFYKTYIAPYLKTDLIATVVDCHI